MSTHAALDWKVRPHGSLIEVDENILTVTGELHIPMDVSRRMTVVRMQDSRLVIFSAISLDKAGMRALEDYGRPAFLVVPNDHHRLDARAWKDRYPDIQVVAPEGARSKVEKAVHVDTSNPDFGDHDVQFVAVAGMQEHEAALIVRSPGAMTLVLNDLVGNIRDESGFGGWFLRKVGFAGNEPQIPKPVKLTMISNKDELRRQLLRWADIPMLKRILVSHGAVIEERASETLRELATSLE